MRALVPLCVVIVAVSGCFEAAPTTTSSTATSTFSYASNGTSEPSTSEPGALASSSDVAFVVVRMGANTVSDALELAAIAQEEGDGLGMLIALSLAETAMGFDPDGQLNESLSMLENTTAESILQQWWIGLEGLIACIYYSNLEFCDAGRADLVMGFIGFGNVTKDGVAATQLAASLPFLEPPVASVGAEEDRCAGYYQQIRANQLEQQQIRQNAENQGRQLTAEEHDRINRLKSANIALQQDANAEGC